MVVIKTNLIIFGWIGRFHDHVLHTKSTKLNITYDLCQGFSYLSANFIKIGLSIQA